MRTYFAISRTRQQGLSLVELLVSMVVVAIVLAGVVQLLLDNRSKFRLNNEIAYIQENVRFAMDELGYELKMAGFNGCGASANVANVVNGTDTFYNGFGVEGWDGSETQANFPSAFSGDLWAVGNAEAPDAIIIRRVDSDNAYTTTESPTNCNAAATLKIAIAHPVPKGTIMVVQTPECSQVAVFQNSQQNTNSNAEQFISNTGSSTSPGNCTKDMGGNGSCSDQTGLTGKCFNKGSTVMEFVGQAFYIGASSIDPTVPALYRVKLRADEATGSLDTDAEELLIGVENMQVKYGVDTDALFDGEANRYLDADDITGVGTLEWDRVVSVRLSLLMRSLSPVWGSDTEFDFEGITYDDRLLRQKVNSTVQLRNLGLVK